MIRTLLIGASVGVALALAFTAAWQPSLPTLAATGDQSRSGASLHSAVAVDDELAADRRRAGRELEMTPDLIDRVVEVAREIDEQMARRLRALCDEYSPQEVERHLRTAHRRLVALADLKSRDPDLYLIKINELQSEARIDVVARQIAEARLAGDESREKALREDMLRDMRIHISMSLAARIQYIKRLEEHVSALKEELERDTMNFDQNVERRIAEAIEQALSEADGSMARSR